MATDWDEAKVVLPFLRFLQALSHRALLVVRKEGHKNFLDQGNTDGPYLFCSAYAL